jgi:hypothetical protein
LASAPALEMTGVEALKSFNKVGLDRGFQRGEINSKKRILDYLKSIIEFLLESCSLQLESKYMLTLPNSEFNISEALQRL